MGIRIRRATHDDYDAVAAFTRDTWPDHGGDYLPEIYHDWLEAEGETDRKTFLAVVDDENSDDEGDQTRDIDSSPSGVAGILQAVLLSPEEAWFQGMRVNPAYRGRGVASRLNEAAFGWARDRGARVGRVMSFGWNAPGLGLSRSLGFEPVAGIRFVNLDPEPDGWPEADDVPAAADRYRARAADLTVAWDYWGRSIAREHLDGLVLDDEESWAVRELTRDDLERYAEEGRLLLVGGEDGGSDAGSRADETNHRSEANEIDAGFDDGFGTSGLSFRARTYERDGDDGVETWVEYGVATWEDVPAARALFVAIAADAAALGADRVRVAIPETARFVSDAAYAGVRLGESSVYVLERDLLER